MQWISRLKTSIFFSLSEDQHYFYDPVSQVSKKLSTFKWKGPGCGDKLSFNRSMKLL